MQFCEQRADVLVCLQAYADYNDLMEMTETMISELVMELKGSYKIQYHANGPDKEPVEIDFSPPWRRVSMIEELESLLDTKFPTDFYSDDARVFLDNLCREKSVECSAPRVRPACAPVALQCTDNHMRALHDVTVTYVVQASSFVKPVAYFPAFRSLKRQCSVQALGMLPACPNRRL